MMQNNNLKLLMVIGLAAATAAFQPQQLPLRSASSMVLRFSLSEQSPLGDSSNNLELQELELVRSALEDTFRRYHMAVDPSVKNSSSTAQQGTKTFQQPLLTTAARRRRQIEMDLVATLKDSDDATDQLVNLWMYETADAKAAACMAAMQTKCSQGLVQEEAALKQMMQDYPAWAEPRVRLAFVYYYTNRFGASYKVAMQALEIKPWHFEAARLLVLLSHRQNDVGKALQEAHHAALPNIRPALTDGDGTSAGRQNLKKRRWAWFNRALKYAESQWQEAEQITQQAFTEAPFAGDHQHHQQQQEATNGLVCWE
jgi:tetratricopeptide (TPR) repeat protein